MVDRPGHGPGAKGEWLTAGRYSRVRGWNRNGPLRQPALSNRRIVTGGSIDHETKRAAGPASPAEPLRPSQPRISSTLLQLSPSL